MTSENVERNSPFADPTDIGHKKISTTSWMAETLATSSDDLQVEVNDSRFTVAVKKKDVA